MFGEKVQNFERFDKLQVSLTECNESTDEIFRKQAIHYVYDEIFDYLH